MYRLGVFAAAGLLACSASAGSAQETAPAVSGPALLNGMMLLCPDTLAGRIDFDDAAALGEYNYRPVEPAAEAELLNGQAGNAIERGDDAEGILIIALEDVGCRAIVRGPNRTSAWGYFEFQVTDGWGFSVTSSGNDDTVLETLPSGGDFARITATGTGGVAPVLSIWDQNVPVENEQAD